MVTILVICLIGLGLGLAYSVASGKIFFSLMLMICMALNFSMLDKIHLEKTKIVCYNGYKHRMFDDGTLERLIQNNQIQKCK